MQQSRQYEKELIKVVNNLPEDKVTEVIDFVKFLKSQNPEIYGILGFILVATPCLYFFFSGFPGTSVSETWNRTETGINTTTVTKTVWTGAFNPFLLIFVIGAAVAAWGCYRSTPMAWIGSLFLFAYSILAMFSIGMLLLPGAIILLTGAVFKSRKERRKMPAI